MDVSTEFTCHREHDRLIAELARSFTVMIECDQ